MFSVQKAIYVIFTAVLGAVLALDSPVLAQKRKQDNRAVVGSVTVNMVGPEGLIRVDGLFPQADAYIKSLEPKFKLTVLSIYAVESEWKAFVDAAAQGRPTAIPRYAMLCAPLKMAFKSYDTKKVRQEFKKYDNWFSLVASNKPMATLLTSQGNKKLKEYMGVNIGFKFHTDKFTAKFADTSGSMSVGARVSFNVFTQPSSVYLTVTALNLADKLIFMAYFENAGPPEVLNEIQVKSLAWLAAMKAANESL